MSGRARHLGAVLGACSALALGACGSDDEPKGNPLPAAASAELQKRLGEIERRYQDAVDNGNVGACEDIGNDSLPAVRDVIAGLPANVDADLRSAVEESFARLTELTENDCADVQPETVPQETVPPETVPQETVPEDTVPHDTVPQDTVPQETVPDEKAPKEPKAPKPEKNKDNGNGGGVEVPPGLGGNG